jgi:hypothetical protein
LQQTLTFTTEESKSQILCESCSQILKTSLTGGLFLSK